MTIQLLRFLKNHILALKIVVGTITALMTLDFLLLVTSLSFHWWVPAWSNAAARKMFVYLIVVATTIGLLQIVRLRSSIRIYNRQGYNYLILQRMIASVNGVASSSLFVIWGVVSLVGQPSALPLKLLVVACVGGFLAFTALQVYDLRRKRRLKLR